MKITYVNTQQNEYQRIKNYFIKGVVFMMMIPRRKNEFDLFDDFFGGDDFFQRRESSIMKTDIKEKNDKYVIEMDLPGYEKENISLKLNDGYLEVSAKVEKEQNEENKGDKYVHKERFYGHCSRNFYVGDEIKEEDIKAKFRNGILEIIVPKKEERKSLPETKYIEIE